MSIEQWIYETIGSDSLRQAASLASLSQATFSRQLTNKSITVETAVKIAHAYQVSVIPALMALDIVTENDIAEFASEATIQDASDEVLSAEVLQMKASSALIDTPIDEVEQHLAEHKHRAVDEVHDGIMNFDTWLKSLPGAPTPTIAAKKSGLAASTLLRHVERGHSTADNVIAIAKAYGVSPIDALVDNRMLEPSDLGGERSPIKAALRDATITELLETLIERVNNSGLIEGSFEMSTIAAHKPSDGANKLNSDPKLDDPWAAAAAVSGKDSWRGDEMVADDSEEEGFLGDDNYSDGP